MSKVKVMYDFVAESGSEISVYSGEELSVIDAHSFEGWIKVRNSQGHEGIVPASYVEYLQDDADDIPPPPSHYPPSYPSSTASNTSWNSPPIASPSYINSPPSYQQDSYVNSYVNQTFVPATSYNPPQPSSASFQNQSVHNPPSANSNHHNSTRADSDSDDFDEDDAPASQGSQQNRTLGNSTLSASGINTFSKHKTKNSYGLEGFLLFGAVKNVLESEKTSTIVLNENRQSFWKRRSPPYTVRIINHFNDKKYHGVKKFVSYEIQAEKFPQKVKRRYNHFDWLYKRLEEKYPNISVPPLPDKAVTGNFEEEFIMKRKAQLELWLNYLSGHPVIGESEVFIHFLQCDDASAKWKSGKRKAEKDDYRGAQWFCTLTVPGESVDTTAVIKDRADKFAKASINLDISVKNVAVALEKINAYHSSTYKKELVTLGKRFEDFGTALSAESLDAPNNASLSRAMVTAGNVYTQIGNSYGEQVKEDIGPLLDRLGLYRGIIQQMPDIVQFEKNAIQSYDEFQSKPEKLQGRSLMEVAPRREIISHVTFAEINQFNRDKVDDLTQYMRSFLQKQIAFYAEITECLKRAQLGFEQIPVSDSRSSSSNKSFKR